MKKRAHRLLRLLRLTVLDVLDLSLESGVSMTGGGSLTTQEIPTALVALRPRSLSAARLEEALRRLPTPVIARIAEDAVLLDVRTLMEEELGWIRDGLSALFPVRPREPGMTP